MDFSHAMGYSLESFTVAGRKERMEGRRERKKQQTRAALLDAAMTLFAERGISGTRVEDVTERADLGKGAFYNYFSSKDALVAELVARGVALLQSEYLSRLNGATDVSSRVAELARLHGRFLDEHPEYALLFHQARGLLLLRNSRVESLREVFADYLLRVGQSMTPPSGNGNGNGAWSDAYLMDIAAALVGGVAGYRSFRAAAALDPQGTAVDILKVGIPELLDQSRKEH